MVRAQRDIVLSALAVRTAGVSPALLNFSFFSRGHGMSKTRRRRAVPERANSTIAPHSEINPTHSFVSSFRRREAPLDLWHRQECLCY
jgi:hypothetical protein